MAFNGEDIQNIVLLSDDLLASLDSRVKASVPVMNAQPATRFWLAGRLPGHGNDGNDVDALEARGTRLAGSAPVARPPQDGEFPRTASS